MLLLCFNICYHSFISSIALCSSSRNIHISDDGQKPYHCTIFFLKFEAPSSFSGRINSVQEKLSYSKIEVSFSSVELVFRARVFL